MMFSHRQRKFSATLQTEIFIGPRSFLRQGVEQSIEQLFRCNLIVEYCYTVLVHRS